MTEQEVWVGSLGQQKVYLHWSDVKDICTNAVSEAYEQAKEENTKLKELLKESRFLLSKTPCENMSQCLTFNDVINRIDQALGEE